MKRMIETLAIEVEIFEAVISRRIRSFVLLTVAIIVPPVLMLIAQHMMATSPVPGLEQGLRPILPLFGLALMFKMLFLSVQIYLKDRAHFLRF